MNAYEFLSEIINFFFDCTISAVISIALLVTTAIFLIAFFFKNSSKRADIPYNLKKAHKNSLIVSIAWSILFIPAIISRFISLFGLAMFGNDIVMGSGGGALATQSTLFAMRLSLLMPVAIVICLISALILRLMGRHRSSLYVQALPLVTSGCLVFAVILATVLSILSSMF